MPEHATIERAHADARQGKSASTQAGEFVHEEIEHVRHGKHGAKSAKQAIAIGLSKARRAGVRIGAPKRGASKKTRTAAKRENGRRPARTARRIGQTLTRHVTHSEKSGASRRFEARPRGERQSIGAPPRSRCTLGVRSQSRAHSCALTLFRRIEHDTQRIFTRGLARALCACRMQVLAAPGTEILQ